ncbi:iron-containing alcohol dehydrogenase family protein [Nocardia rhamnosiphila]|uniref:Iron-containing alcohol dehydrogenase family protein n=1 Tax=Nocardia rhamnosiphila TaxID=426716 RepID=A0ABV2WYN3_9NOCA
MPTAGTTTSNHHAGSVRRAPLRVQWGPGSLAAIGDGARRAGAQRLLVITSRSVAARTDLLALLDEATMSRVVEVFAETRAHSPVESVMTAAEVIAARRIDGIVAVGGGSVMVTARAANIVHGENRPPAELATYRDDKGWTSPRLSAAKLPCWAVPTTPTTATGKAGAAVTQEGLSPRLALFDPKTRAQAIAVLPEFLDTAPEALVTSASLNGLCMAFEGLVSVHANLWSEAALTGAGRRLARLLDPRTMPDPPDRVELTLAALLSGDGSDLSRGGVGAALSHTIGHLHHVPNGLVEAALLPWVIARVASDHPGRTAAAAALSTQDEPVSAETVPAALTGLLERIGTPTRLRDLGLRLDDLPRAAETATGDFAVSSAHGRPGSAELLDLLRRAW